MSNNELLELAAKAAGYTLTDGSSEYRSFRCYGGVEWNPRKDSGQALQLAIDCGISVTPYPVYENPKHSVVAEVKRHAECPNSVPPLRYCVSCSDPCQKRQAISVVEMYGTDQQAATRLAILRAAVELAKETP